MTVLQIDLRAENLDADASNLTLCTREDGKRQDARAFFPRNMRRKGCQELLNGRRKSHCVQRKAGGEEGVPIRALGANPPMQEVGVDNTPGTHSTRYMPVVTCRWPRNPESRYEKCLPWKYYLGCGTRAGLEGRTSPIRKAQRPHQICARQKFR